MADIIKEKDVWFAVTYNGNYKMSKRIIRFRHKRRKSYEQRKK